MKKKLLVLSASAILASNFVFDNSASAVVKKSDYESKALKVEGKINYSISIDRYKEHLGNLIYSQSLNDFARYDEPEYKNAYEKYQHRFLAEIDAFNKFLLEEKEIDENYKNNISNYNYRGNVKLLGLTQERYQTIYDSLKQNKKDFDDEVKKIEDDHPDLKRFDWSQKHKAKREVFELEHKALMLPVAFKEHKETRDNLYNKLDMLLGFKKDERQLKEPTNERMLKDIKESLETIIDEFFKDIKAVRPVNIPILTEYNKDSYDVKKQLRDDTEAATRDDKYADSNFRKRADKLKEDNEKALAEREAKAKELKEKGLLRGKEFNARNYPLYFPHKKLNNNSKVQKPSEKQLVFKEVNEQPKQHSIYTETVTSTPQPVLKQEKREEIVTSTITPRFNQNNTLKGMEGESTPVTVVSEPAIKATAAPQQKIVEENPGFSGSNNNLSGMGGESNALNFTYDSQAVNNDTFTESNEIVLDQHTDIKVSGYTTGESIEDSYVTNEVTK
ncbi:coagulase [Staphylococcus agnetis]|uniref:coagulase domain-containing protein n=1 Tax=Staphylococcus agnetis TaxID=985762 RepID=UPI000D1B8E5C|nr:coagulase domain-containing protein [Staphylococcus agnetis]PTH65381.1 coagulase [Staphylococcus agnetis]